MTATPEPALPGRAVDIVVAAAKAAHVPLSRVSVTFIPGLHRPGWVRLLVGTEQGTAIEAETLLRQLGIAEPIAEVTTRYGYREARYEHDCTAFGKVVVVIRITESIADPAPAADLGALVAQVDAARAAADEAERPVSA
jgi:hypothetical protein